MNFRNKNIEELDVNITPLIDVVFLLLIFFMVSTTFEHQSELSIDLPQASGEVTKSEKKILEISIDASGLYYINGKKLSDAKIETLLAQIKQKTETIKQPKIIISADKNTPHQAVMSVMDAARRLKITHLTFAAVKPD
ncbi:MAG: biopolymer transporter ExbD [Pseudomonadota bacterium]